MNKTPSLTAQGKALDMSPDALGELRSSMDVVDDSAALQERMREDGYLYLPRYLNRDEVLNVRSGLLGRLADAGLLEPGTAIEEAIARKDRASSFMPELADDNPALLRLLYEGRMMAFYTRLLDGVVRHFDYTWVRAVSHGSGTAPHCDIVFMGRGTTNLFTAWTPIGDIPKNVGGLAILENSHKHDRLREGYGRKDADEYCENRLEASQQGPGNGKNIGPGGMLSYNPVQLRARLGGRWLTSDFEAGDLLTFSMYTVHGSLDNHSDQIRLSTDTRYQLASEPADERWIGENRSAMVRPESVASSADWEVRWNNLPETFADGAV